MSDAASTDALTKVAASLVARHDYAGAEQMLSPMLSGRINPAVQHLMGRIRAAAKNYEEAERYYRSAISHALARGDYYNDLGVVLQARGAYAEAARNFRAALALMPDTGPIYVNLVRCQLALQDVGEAEAMARDYVRAQPNAESWTLLLGVQRTQGRFEDAVESAGEALAYAPNARGLLHNRAIVLEQAGRVDEANAAYEDLAREGVDSIELAVNFARAIYRAGRGPEAESVIERAFEEADWRTNLRAHTMLMRMRLLRGARDECLAVMEETVKARAEDLTVRLMCAELANSVGLKDKAAALLKEGMDLAPGSPAFSLALGAVYDELGRTEEAVTLLRYALANAPASQTASRQLMNALLRAGKAPDALALARAALTAAPDDQHARAYEAVCLRVTSDPRYTFLCDYERLVRVYELPVPRGFFSPDLFNAALGESLRALHDTSAHPLDQTIDNASQTGRNLVHVREPNLEAFFDALSPCIEDYADGLDPASGHPLDARKTEGYVIREARSLRMRASARLAPHVHTGAWISGVYFVDAPQLLETSPERAGWIEFGAPPLPVNGAEADYFMRPRAGLLVLFPAFLWHAVRAFTQPGERLTVAFDVTPT